MSHRTRSSFLGLVCLTAGLGMASACHEITSVDPTVAEQGQLIFIGGAGLGDDQADSRLLYDGLPITVQTWSDTEISANLPDPKSDGVYTVQVEVRGRLSNALTHEIQNAAWNVAVPDGAVTFQSGATCAPGWEPVVDAEGRFLVGRTDGTQVGITTGAPLAAGEDRAHNHGYSTTVNVGSKGLAGIDSCCTDLGAKDSHAVNGATDAGQAGPPRLYQLVCERVVTDPPTDLDDHSVPNFAVMFFNDEGCPDGFELVAEANGRFLVSTLDPVEIGATVGTPLASGENRTHSHAFSSSISVSERSIAGLGGGSRYASDGTKNFSGTTVTSDSGVPYLQLLACRAQVRPDPPADEPIVGDLLPDGVFSFFDSNTCPQGWSPSGLHQGRFMTGVQTAAAGGIPFETRGGAPLGPAEDRVHSHSFSGTVNVPLDEIALAPGCCNGGFGRNGSYGYSGTTSPAALGLPYLQLLGCEKDS